MNFYYTYTVLHYSYHYIFVCMHETTAHHHYHHAYLVTFYNFSNIRQHNARFVEL